MGPGSTVAMQVTGIPEATGSAGTVDPGARGQDVVGTCVSLTHGRATSPCFTGPGALRCEACRSS